MRQTNREIETSETCLRTDGCYMYLKLYISPLSLTKRQTV